jgi:mannose/fructose/N-acetylgalactosamine-specific phosphotransferase system component IIC
MTPLDVAILIILGGVLGLDTVSFPQAMLSRPIVAGTLAGALMGQAGRGLLLGAALELFAVDTLPFGASRYPEWGSSSVVGAGLFAMLPGAIAGGLTTSVLATLIVAWVGGWSMVRVRLYNARRARMHQPEVARGDRKAVIGLQLSGLTVDLLRGMLLTGAGLLVLGPVQHVALAAWSVGPAASRAVVVSAAAAVSLGAAYKLFHVIPGFLWQFLLGLGAGLVIVVLQ